MKFLWNSFKMSIRIGEVIKKSQNPVNIVFEWPLSKLFGKWKKITFANLFTFDRLIFAQNEIFENTKCSIISGLTLPSKKFEFGMKIIS